MKTLIVFACIVWGFFAIKGLLRFALCQFNMKEFMSESTYVWIGFLMLFSVIMLIAAGFLMVIKLMVSATL